MVRAFVVPLQERGEIMKLKSFYISHTVTVYGHGETCETCSLEEEERGQGFDDLSREDLVALNNLLTHYLYGRKEDGKAE